MGFDSFKENAEALIEQVQQLAAPMSELPDGQWSEDVGLSNDEQREVGDLGTVKLQGSVEAALFLTRRYEAPEDLDEILVEPGEEEHAIATARLVAEAGAELNHQQPIAAGAGITLGAEAAARLAVGQHRQYRLSDSGLDALRDLLAHLRNPYDVDALGELVEGEVFGIELSGSGQLSASAGWQAGIVRSFEGTKLEELVPGELGGFTATAKAAFTVEVGVEGEMRVLVDRSPRDPQQVRVRLLRKRGNFIGAGLDVSVGVQLTQADFFVDSVFHKLLALPDGLVARLEGLKEELDDLQGRLDGLEDEAKEAVAEATGAAEGALGLDTLARLRARADDLPAALRNFLAPFFEALDRITGVIDDGEQELDQFVGKVFDVFQDPLDELSAKLDSWLDGYRQARQKAAEFVKERAREGITAELKAGFNRTRTSEALLELDFVLESAGLLCIETMKGNFKPALERALTPGATGVEIAGGTLKETSKKTRFYNLKLNLFGFRAKVDFESWSQVQVTTDVRTGALSISGEAGAKLTADTNRHFNELSFLFDAYGAFEQRGDTILTTSETDFRATLLRSTELRKAPHFRPAMRRHLRGARLLGLLDREREAELIELLFSDTASTYDYELGMAFPATAVERMFALDRPDGDKQLRAKLWQWMRQASDILDVILEHGGAGNVQDARLSHMYVESAIDFVRKKPMLLPGNAVPQAIRAIRPGGHSLQIGAYRRAWAYLRNAHFFIEGYLKTRHYLRSQVPLQQATDALSKIAGKAITGAGAISLQPFDAKYLVFALAEGLREVELSMTFRRGQVDVTI